MNPVSNICRLLSHKSLQNISHKACFGINISQRRCISGLNQLSDISVNLRGRTGAPLCMKSGHSIEVMKRHVFPSIFYIPRRMAGHSHYANIKDTKEKFDKQKSVIRAQFLPKIVRAIREGGSTKPSQNAALDRLIKEGKKQNIPLSSFEKVLKREEARLQRGGGDIEEFHTELVASGGIAIIVLGEHNQKLKSTCNSVIKKFPELKRGTTMLSFEKKGYVLVILGKEENTIDLDKYLEIGIEVGAEDVVIDKDSEDEKIIKFICDSRMVNQLDKALSSKGLEVLIAEAVYEPKTTVAIDQEQMEYLDKIINKLQESEDITNVYTNAVLE